MNNSEFGKMIENNRKQRDMQLVTKEKTRNKLASSVDFNGTKHNSDFLPGFDMKNNKLTMNSIIFAGEKVLDFTKILIYDFD